MGTMVARSKPSTPETSRAYEEGMPHAALSPVLRGILMGLVGGLLVGGLALLAFGADAMLRGPDCTGFTPEECALKRDIAVTFGRQQVRAGGALALMGLAVFMLARPRLRRADPDGTQR
jgi:hypothetical protein